MVQLKYLSDFLGTREMPLITCQISLQLNWSKKCILVSGTAANQVPQFKKMIKKIYVPVATLSTQDNIKLLRNLEYGF